MEFRSITPEEVDPFFLALSTAFADAHPDADEIDADKTVIEPDRTFAAFDDGAIVGCAGAFTQRMVVPGGALTPTAGITLVGVWPTHRRRGILRELMTRMLAQARGRGGALTPTAGITLVGVWPTHRRRGILRELMTRMLAQARDRGEAVTSLFASQAAIYGRFGYGMAANHLSLDIALDRVRWAPGTEATGRTRLLARADALPLMRRVYDDAFGARPGALEVD